MTLLYTDPIFLEHDTGWHVESAERLRAIARHLEETSLAGRCPRPAFQPISQEELLRTHSREQVLLVERTARQGGGMLDPDTVVCPRSWDVALAAAGACCAAVDAVLAGEDKTAVCLVRPPGHHATPQRSMGFCLFNNVALAARRAREGHGLDRVLIVDWDVHHGNGTQDIFYADPTVFFYSIHRYPFYPGTGSREETGTGPGLGYTLNVPLPFGVSRKEYQDAFTAALATAADKSKPQLVLISAGFDAHAEDPIGSLGLHTEDFRELTRAVLDVARTHAGGRIVSCLEGGYNTRRLAESLAAHLQELLTDP
jgi:acetoin utilization deacetylase AcuC-like enzyme